MKLTKKQVEVFNVGLLCDPVDFEIEDNELKSIQLLDTFGHSWVYLEEDNIKEVEDIEELVNVLLNYFNDNTLDDEFEVLISNDIPGKPSTRELIDEYSYLKYNLPGIRKEIIKLLEVQ